MSAVSRIPTLTGLRMSADDYLALGVTPDRYELIDGIVVMSPSPTFRQQKIAALLFRQIDRHIDARGGDLVAETDIRLAPTSCIGPI
jgi:hypothetical protein